MPYALLLSAVLAFGAGWTVRHWKAGADAAQALRAASLQREADGRRTHAAAVQFERERAALAGQARTVTREVDRVVEKPVYRNVCLDADGLRVIADAIAAPGPASQPAAAVRPAGAPTSR